MKKITGKIMAIVSAAVMCTAPMLNNISASAATTKSKTYVVYDIAQNKNIAYFDFTINYGANVTVEESVATPLCNGGYFSSILNTSSRKILNTYNGSAIGATGNLCETKFIVPMSIDSIYDVVTYSNVVIRNANGVTISPTSITTKEILLGDANQDGVVDTNDVDLIMNSMVNPDKYKLTEDGRDAADVYRRGDGITGMDAVTIQEYINGEISHF